MVLAIADNKAAATDWLGRPNHAHQIVTIPYSPIQAFVAPIEQALKEVPTLILETHKSQHTAKPALPTGRSLWLSLFAKTCYYGNVAEEITQALKTCFSLAEDTSDKIHIALHEALANAVMHGNLAVSGVTHGKDTYTNLSSTDDVTLATQRENAAFCSAFDTGLNANQYYNQYYEWIESKLALPAFGFSRIHIGCTVMPYSLVLEVMDEGAGYSYSKYLSGINHAAAHRGLRLILSSCNNVQLLRNGNHIQMQFEVQSYDASYSNS